MRNIREWCVSEFFGRLANKVISHDDIQSPIGVAPEEDEANWNSRNVLFEVFLELTEVICLPINLVI